VHAETAAVFANSRLDSSQFYSEWWPFGAPRTDRFKRSGGLSDSHKLLDEAFIAKFLAVDISHNDTFLNNGDVRGQLRDEIYILLDQNYRKPKIAIKAKKKITDLVDDRWLYTFRWFVEKKQLWTPA